LGFPDRPIVAILGNEVLIVWLLSQTIGHVG
jgi:hypothetical protein